jgi:hypothetical protein
MLVEALMTAIVSIPKPTKPPRVRQPLRRGAPLKRGKRPNPKRETPLARQEEEADRLWSAIVMAEAERICEPCRFLYGETHKADDPAHVISRRYQATKHLPSNGVAACRKMHDWLKDHPPGREDSRMKAFASAYRGEFVFGTLERLALKGAKFEPVTLVLLRARARGMGIKVK